MSTRRTLRRLLPVLLFALLGAAAARQRAAKQPEIVEKEPLALPPVEAAIEATTVEISLEALLVEASEPSPVEAALIVAEAVPADEIAVTPAADVHMITVVDDLLSGRSAEKPASISG
jgi:hypothetical protein